jgi:hypothetical protein
MALGPGPVPVRSDRTGTAAMIETHQMLRVLYAPDCGEPWADGRFDFQAECAPDPQTAHVILSSSMFRSGTPAEQTMSWWARGPLSMHVRKERPTRCTTNHVMSEPEPAPATTFCFSQRSFAPSSSQSRRRWTQEAHHLAQWVPIQPSRVLLNRLSLSPLHPG